MKIVSLKERTFGTADARLSVIYSQFSLLVQELQRRELPDHIVMAINQELEQLNASPLTGADLRKQVKATQRRILRQLEKQLKIVPKNYYRNLWLSLGMAAFGLPIGVAMSTAIHNPAFSGIGLPIGMALGIAIGSGMDKKALAEGRQLEMEVKL